MYPKLQDIAAVIGSVSCILFSGLVYSQGRISIQKILDERNEGFNQDIWSFQNDEEGYLWIGARDGLYRYDAYHFRKYSYNVNSPVSLKSNQIRNTFRDDQGVLWLATFKGGLSRYNTETDNFTTFIFDSDTGRAISPNTINELIQDKRNKNILWLASGSGLLKFDKDQQTFYRYRRDLKNENSLNQDMVLSLYQDDKGIIWLGLASYGLDRFDPESEEFTHYRISTGNDNLDFKANVIREIVPGKKGLWLATYGGLHFFDLRTKSFRSFFDDDSGIAWQSLWDLLPDGNRLWIATYGSGLYTMDLETEEITKTPVYVIGGGDFSKAQIRSLYLDRQSNLWIGTSYGLYRHSKMATKADRFIDLTESLKDGGFAAPLYENSQGNIYISSAPFLIEIDKNSRLISKWKIPELRDMSINDIIEHEGHLWLATSGKGLLRFDLKRGVVTKSFLHHPNDSLSLNHDYINTLFSDGGRLLIGTAVGLNVLDLEREEFIRFTEKRHNYQKLGFSDTNDIEKDDNGIFWIATGRGLTWFDPEADSVFVPSGNDLLGKTINHLRWADSSHLWMATNYGLGKINTTSLQVDNNYDHLFGSEIMWVVSSDHTGNLWVKKDKGLGIFNGQTVTYLNSKKGVVESSGTALISSYGTVYIGARNGLYTVNPEKIPVNNTTSKPVITDFEVLGESGVSHLLTGGNDAVVLDHQENFLTFKFSHLNYVIPEENSFAYRLKGFNENWIHTNAFERTANFTGIPPGDYTFELKAANNDGIWSSEMATLKIEILPPPWRTWWAWLLYIFTALLVTFLALRTFIVRERLKNRLRMERMEVKKMQEVNALKSSFFAGISHEFRTPLTLITAPADELLKKHNADRETEWNLNLIKRNANRLLRLINQLLDLSKLEVGKLKLQVRREDVVVWIRNLATSFESLAASREIRFSVNVLCPPVNMLFDKDKLEQILINLLSNAFKYAPVYGYVDMNVSLEDHQLCVQVINDGPGIAENEIDRIFDRFYRSEYRKSQAEGTGIGLALVKEFTELHHGSVIVASSEEGPTTFTVHLPVSDSAYTTDAVADVEVTQVSKVIWQQLNSEEPADETINHDEDSSSVLIVEDNDDLRSYITSQLTHHYQVLEASDGLDGLKTAISTIPDLIITDLMMPEMDGIEMLQAIRNDIKTRHVPVIMLTARADRESRLEGIEKGADHYLNKPFDIEELKVRVKSLLIQRTRIRDHYYSEFIANPRTENILSVDDRFLKKVVEVIERELDNHELSVDHLAGELAMSRVQLHRKLKAIIGCSASEFIRGYRLKKAHEYLKGRKGSVSEIAYSVGFNNLSYFTKTFKGVYKTNPSDLLK